MDSGSPLLKAVAILEKDSNNDILWSWVFPSLEKSERSSVQAKVSFEAGEFLVVHLDSEAWFYTLSQPGSSSSGPLQFVLSAAIVLKTDEFHPEKYIRVLTALSEAYLDSGSPPDVLRVYLSAQAEKLIKQGDVTLSLQTFSDPAESVPIKELVQCLQLETILIYTALLLRLRVIVYHHSPGALRGALSAMAALMAHRDCPFTDMYPLLCNSEHDMQLLKGKTSYLAGFTDASVAAHQDLRDLWVSLPSAEVVITPSAKEALARCKTHKDIALFLIRCAENGQYSDKDVVKEISAKTRSLISTIGKIVHENASLTADKAIQIANLPPAMESFYRAVARVERIHN
ncbi:protein FAM45A-like [Varroa jacobsoni]|uniref:UDENN domain-containing protein n=1 Tax=Varroa destructor TaxID=109461 RepID=A0A7M7KWP5_VARDE|nr:protein FAM45A-like [Varroa destructor]XP_022703650.1 protein FAM45A-like [Varroa jacobsoni]